MAEARLGLARLGASRLGDYRPYVFLTIAGVARRLRIQDLTIMDSLGATPNTAIVRVSGFEPSEGQDLKIGLGGLDVNHYVFAGHILKRTRIYEADNVANVAYDLSCISYEWRLNRRKVFARFVGQSATTIAQSLIASYAPEFTVAHVAADLPTIDEITFTAEDMTDALDRLTARVGGDWYVDYGKDLHLFLTEAESATTIDDTHRGASHVVFDRDLSPVRTRIELEGGGNTASASAVPGDTAIAIGDVQWYETVGGTVVSGPQRIDYTGVVAGGAGALVGTTVTPTNGPATARRATTGLTAGDYRWVVTFITASGETLPSPASAVLTLGGAVEPPISAPTITKLVGGNLSAGVYQWKYAYLTAAGETLAGSASASVTMDDVVAAPTAIGTAAANDDGNLDASAVYSYKFTFSNGDIESGPSPASNTFTTPSGPGGNIGGKMTVAGNTAAPSGYKPAFYRTEGGGSTFKKLPGDSTRWGFATQDAFGNWEDTYADTSLGSTIPSSGTATYRSASVAVVASTNPLVTYIRVYRTAAGGSTFKAVADLANTTTTYTDNTADASLGSTELSTATAFYLAADLTGIAIGPTGTTQRNVYRTAHDGSTYGLQSNIPNNTATTLTDTTADGSLGAAPPVTDTSGLVQQTGDVSAGSTSLLVTSTAPFRSAGGWAFIGALAIRYTGFSGTALTGIPALGTDGALGTTVKYGVEVVAAPMLTGIPASGDGAIQYNIRAGDDVNLLVTVNDLDAQAALAALVGGDGVVVEYIQDRRLSNREALSRAEARLALVKDPLVIVRYETFDRRTHSGAEVSFASTLLGLTGTFKIQGVNIRDFDGNQRRFPRRQVVASSRRFTLEALLRQSRAAIG